jgi:hypothetical protein
VKDEAVALDHQADAAGVRATPTIFVGKSGRKPTQVVLRSATDEHAVVRALDAALASLGAETTGFRTPGVAREIAAGRTPPEAEAHVRQCGEFRP